MTEEQEDTRHAIEGGEIVEFDCTVHYCFGCKLEETNSELKEMTSRWHNTSLIVAKIMRSKTLESVKELAESGKHFICSTVLRKEGSENE